VEVILLHPIQELALDLYLNPQIYLMEPYKWAGQAFAYAQRAVKRKECLWNLGHHWLHG
jgi:hypothetical protein